MPLGEATLSYQSKMGGSLAPGEQVLWEDRPHFPAMRKQALLRIILLISVPLAAAILSAIASRGDWLFIVIVTLVVGGMTTLGIVRAGKIDPRRRFPLLAHAVYRITNQRIMRMDDRPGRPHQQVEIEAICELATVHGRHPRITMDEVTFEELPDINAVVLRVLVLWAKSGRRWRVRRMPAGVANERTIERNDLPEALPKEIMLAEGEHLLWVGRPRVRDPIDRRWLINRLIRVAWMLLPASVLIAWWGIVPWAPRPSWWITIIAGLWIVLALKGMTFNVLRERRERARTIFVLSNIRALAHIGGRAPSTRSNLLDMVDRLNIEHKRDGTSDVWIGRYLCKHLHDADAAHLHRIALEAVRIAGTPAGGIIKPAEVLEEP